MNPVSKVKFNKYKYVEISDIKNNKIINSTDIKKQDIPVDTKRNPLINDIIIESVRTNSKKIVYMTVNYYKDNLLLLFCK